MKRKRYSSNFKSKVAIESIQGELTVAQLAAKHGVHPSQVQTWKAALLKNSSIIFEKKFQKQKPSGKHVSLLERKVGQQAIEIDFLKKKLF